MSRLGKPSIFIDKVARVQGVLSRPGSKRFEQARGRLTKLASWPTPASDGDTIEALSRGWTETKRYLKRRKR